MRTGYLKAEMMYQTLYRISKMDCPSEEALIRQRLEGVGDIVSLRFDLSKRELTVFHHQAVDDITAALAELNLGSVFLGSVVADAATIFPEAPQQMATQRQLLWAVLLINLAFFFIEGIGGWLSGSMGLVADGLDMLADSMVYGLSLLAVGSTTLRKRQVATTAGWLQIGLACLGFLEVVRRVFGAKAMPDFQTMVMVSLLALMANAVCLWLLQRAQSQEAHMQASMIFTSNDVLVNIGVMVSAVAVWFSGSRWPDLLVGTLVFMLVLRGARRILALGRSKPVASCGGYGNAER